MSLFPPIPTDYPLDRESAVPVLSGREFRNLQQAWDLSRQRLQALQAQLRRLQLDSRVATVAVSGSLGRMEALDHSDADLIVIVRDAQPLSSADRRTIMQQIWAGLEPLSLIMPAEDGIFTAAVNWQSLCDDGSLGQIDESTAIFGTRIQLLLDSQPVLHRDTFDQLLAQIVRRYARGDVAYRPTSPWTYLTNDLIRYYRCLGLDAQWRSATLHCSGGYST